MTSPKNVTTAGQEEEPSADAIIEVSDPTIGGKSPRKRSMTTNTTNNTGATLIKSGGGRKPRKSTSKKADTAKKETPYAQKLSKKTPSSLPSVPATTAPRYVLVLDNGSDTIKYGWSIDPQLINTNNDNNIGIHTTNNDSNHIQEPNTPKTTQCQYMPNITARLTQQWTVLIGNDITTQVKNPNVSCTAVTRSCTERGMITNMGNQIQVWKHILDTLHVTISPLKSTETSIAFGWNKVIPKTNQHRDTNVTNHPSSASSSHATTKFIPSNQCGVMIGVPPYTPRSIIEHIMSIWYDEFQFRQVGFCVSTGAAPTVRPMRPMIARPPSNQVEQSNVLVLEDTTCVVPIACVVDLGYSAVHVIPLYDKRVISSTTSSHHPNHGTIRRIPFGGKHMINLLKYYCSYRQWNLMDSEWIVRDVFEATAFVSTSFRSDMKLAQKIPYFGRRPYDCEYILPNYDTTTIGQVQIPESVQIEIERLKQHQSADIHTTINDEDANDDEDEDDEDYNENDMNVDDVDYGSDDDMEDDDDDDENELPEQIRQRLLKQREDERRQREMEAEQQQILNVSTERFAIPEALFRPSDVGLPTNWANVPQAIVQSIEACPPIYRPGLYRSIQLTGGLSQLPNFKDRLLVELRALVPCQYTLNITIGESPIDQAWIGMASITRQEPYESWSVSREEWEGLSRRGAWKRLQVSNGGYFI